ncbi:LOW QUALITY PROTEIN: P2X purinoceptor 4-like [Uloborus diversus]|uniref:LOW QUALITY PROTEIN: P2X purinoceptor 4-like n=1 Tax=Uloborus diversus TaxID=327109 RepID=UPI00240938AB|nr:LOW QUALITY PROTEIN: P2X purinoceptor 4-like [Uloborus diversus]
MTNSRAKQLFLSIFEYYTPKIVLIKDLKIGILNRLVQLTIISYIIGYAIIWNKGYQEFSTIESSVTTKVKGVVYTNFTKDQFDPRIKNIEDYRRIWDTADYVVPPSENNAFFVITNIVITSNQTQGTCPEDPSVYGAECKTDSDCIAGHTLPTGNGAFTGKCTFSDMQKGKKVCEIVGWCPVERDINPLLNSKALLSNTKTFTVLLKNFVDFPKFKIKRRNIPNFKDPNYLKRCNYHPTSDPLCPIFVLKDIVPGDYEKLALKGAAVAIIIKWDCNFDFAASKCFPTYEFRRLDEDDSPIAPGLNFRYAHYYTDSQRTLYKAYGIKFIIMAQGRGGKFNVVPLFLNIGSGLGLLAVATILCDIIVLYIVKKRDVYKSMKYQEVVEDPANNNVSCEKKGSESFLHDPRDIFLKPN